MKVLIEQNIVKTLLTKIFAYTMEISTSSRIRPQFHKLYFLGWDMMIKRVHTINTLMNYRRLITSVYLKDFQLY